MENFQPWLNFNRVNRAEIVSRLHGKFQLERSLNFSSNPGEISARAETIRSQNVNGAIPLLRRI